eukprot:tig00001668_g9547.t1
MALFATCCPPDVCAAGRTLSAASGREASLMPLRHSKPLLNSRPATRGVRRQRLWVAQPEPSRWAAAPPCCHAGSASATQARPEIVYAALEKLTPPRRPDASTIELTPKERDVFELLLEVARHYDLKTQMRVAGGWVRDKLLGMSSPDIDIALDDMLGVEFAEMVNLYLRQKGEMTHSIGVIHSNPEQSKHLETAHLPIFGLHIDFVNLRCEEYSCNSRIPAMTLGTAKEDAFRRDLTINALFYNINKGAIEDLTGQGLRDLSSGIVRTPLAPRVTFLDDPLRVLRAIRFASRLRFSLDPELVSAARDPEVHSALEQKVSRERIGIEVSGMLAGPHPVRALASICDLDLFPVVFAFPTCSHGLPESHDARRPLEAACVHHAAMMFSLIRHRPKPVYTAHSTLLLASFMYPMKEFFFKEKRKCIPVTNYLVQNSLRRSASETQEVAHLMESAASLRKLVHRLESGAALSRVELGLVLRKVGASWQDALDLALAHDMVHVSDHMHDGDSDEQLAISRLKELYERFRAFVVILGLVGVWDLKPHYDGEQICRRLNIRPGPMVGSLLQAQIEWQLEFPDACVKQ